MKGQYDRQHSGSVRVVVAAALTLMGGSLVPQAIDVSQPRGDSPSTSYVGTYAARANVTPALPPVDIRIFQPQSGAPTRERQNHTARGRPANDAHNPSAHDLITALRQQDERGLAQMVDTLASTHSLAGASRMVALRAPDLYGGLVRYCAARGLLTASRSPARVSRSNKPTWTIHDTPQSNLDKYPMTHIEWLEEFNERDIRDGYDNEICAEKLPPANLPRTEKKADRLVKAVLAGKVVTLFGGFAET
jgi:hypothetical protein